MRTLVLLVDMGAKNGLGLLLRPGGWATQDGKKAGSWSLSLRLLLSGGGNSTGEEIRADILCSRVISQGYSQLSSPCVAPFEANSSSKIRNRVFSRQSSKFSSLDRQLAVRLDQLLWQSPTVRSRSPARPSSPHLSPCSLGWVLLPNISQVTLRVRRVASEISRC